MVHETEKLKADRPAQLARETLGEALGLIQDIKNKQLDVDEVTASIARAVGALFAVQSSEAFEPAHTAGVLQAMDHLRVTLELMQEVQGEDAALISATQTIAKTLAMLYPISKVQERQSMQPAAPAAVMGDQLPHDKRRSVQRVAIEADIGFQSDSNFFTGFSEDISAGGVFIATFEILPIGSTLQVNFTMPDGYLISTSGIVRWVREYNELAEDTEPGMGIQFDGLVDHDKNIIESYLTQREPIFYDE